jgi:hypothetical protein
MKNRHRFGNLLGYVDILMNILMCFIAMFIFAFILIKISQPVKTTTAKTDKSASSEPAALQPKGKLIIHLHWRDNSNTDLDLWVRSDNPSHIISFREKDVSNMWLDHDSQGENSNKVFMADGTYKQAFGNDEIIQIKECTNTRINVNIHNYKPADDKTEFPLTATVELIEPPTYNKALTKTLTMSGDKGEEKTAFSFNLDEECRISDIDQDTFIPFVYTVLNQTTQYPRSAPAPTGNPP